MLKHTYKTTLLLLFSLLIVSCSHHKKNVDEPVSDVGSEDDALIQVNPMIPNAVRMLLLESEQLTSEGQGEQAILTLKRAFSISPESALVQQHLAEVYLAEADYKEALYWSTLVVNQGPDRGELCERSRRTQALAAELLGEVEIQARALDSMAVCTAVRPARY